MTIKSDVSNKEVVDLLRQLIDGKVEIFMHEPPFGWAHGNGEIPFNIGGYIVWFFNDVGELDYIDRVIAPDGREAQCDSWGYDSDPIDALTEDEYEKLEEKLYSAK